MKRSSINDIIRDGDAFIRSSGYILPPFAYWSLEEMKARRKTSAGIFERRLGWDVTDYGHKRGSTSLAFCCSHSATAASRI